MSSRLPWAIKHVPCQSRPHSETVSKTNKMTRKLKQKQKTNKKLKTTTPQTNKPNKTLTNSRGEITYYSGCSHIVLPILNNFSRIKLKVLYLNYTAAIKNNFK